MGNVGQNVIKPIKTEHGWYQCNNFWDYWEQKQPLGNGRTCEVVVVQKKNDQDKTEYACKIIKKTTLNMKRLFEREFHILKKLNHPNCVRLIGAYVDNVCYYLVTSLSRGGELFDRIKKGPNYSEEEVRIIVTYFLSALKHCHDQNIVHRDLKPENFLMDDDKRLSNVRLIDFGSAAQFENNSKELYSDLAGTPYYMSPEAVRNVKRVGEDLKPTDMWSCGVITFVLLCGKPPFGGREPKDIFTKILRGKLSWPPDTNWSNELKDFLRRCITRNMHKRLTVKQALEHPFITRE